MTISHSPAARSNTAGRFVTPQRHKGFGDSDRPAGDGHVVHQMLCDYQNQARGGSGWLRLMQFLPDGVTVQVQDYSPLLGKLNNGRQTHFAICLAAARRTLTGAASA